MTALTDLDQLLAQMSPVLDPVHYVFAAVPVGVGVPDIPAIMRFTETEGETLIIAEAYADTPGLTVSPPHARITLAVTSSLEAVGFLARVCSALAEAGISTNAVAAYHHDHIFVPASRADDAMQVLTDLSGEIARSGA